MQQVLEKKAELLNAQFFENRETIERMQDRLKSDPVVMNMMPDAKDAVHDFISDKVTLFKFLRDQAFNEDKAVVRLLDTLQWRQEHHIYTISQNVVASEFFENGFAFFHGQDNFGRPIAVVRMKRFPQFRDKSKTLTDHIWPYACLVMEMARRLLRDITCERERRGESRILVAQIAVIIDIAKAPFIPIDANLVQTLMGIMEKRFPGFVGSVYVMNFGWMYQGLWQMIKYLLSDEARSSISFPSLKEILEIVSIDTLLKELGGNNAYTWSLENDTVLKKYGTGIPPKPHPLLPSPISSPSLSPISTPISSPISSPTMSPTMTPAARSSRSWSVTSEDFFDAEEFFADAASTMSSYGTPGTMSPKWQGQGLSNWPLWPVNDTPVRVGRPHNICYWTGLHMGASFLTSFVGTRTMAQRGIDGYALASRLTLIEEDEIQLDLDFHPNEQTLAFDEPLAFDEHELAQFKTHTPHFPHLLPRENRRSLYAIAPIRAQMQKFEQRVIRITRRVFRLSFAYKGAIYWVLLYVFLRGPVESVLRKSLTNFISTPQKVAYTTVGLTAAMAAAIGSSVTASITAGP